MIPREEASAQESQSRSGGRDATPFSDIDKHDARQ